MGFVKDLFGGDSGMGFRAAPVSIANPVTQAQIDSARARTEGGLNTQDAFVQALTQQANPAIASQGALNSMLLNQSTGGGPNPAQDEYRRNIGQIAAQQSGAIASQKGINPALAARMIMQQGGAAQQNAAASAAALRANQTLAAQQLLAQNSAQQVGQAMGGQQSYNQAAQGQQNSLLNALQGYNTNAVGAQSNMNLTNASVAGHTADAQMGLMKGIGTAVGIPGMAEGGEVPPMQPNHDFLNHIGKKYFNDGGIIDVDFEDVTPPARSGVPMPINGPASEFGRMLYGARPMNASRGAVVPGKAPVNGDSRRNDIVPIMASPEEIVLPRSVTKSKNAPKEAAKFVAAVLSKKGRR